MNSSDEAIAARLRNVLESHDGVASLADASGLTRQTIYAAMKTGRSFGVIRAIATEWPDVDIRWLLTGEVSESNIVDTYGDPLLDLIADCMSDQEEGDVFRARLEGYVAGLRSVMTRDTRKKGPPEPGVLRSRLRLIQGGPQCS